MREIHPISGACVWHGREMANSPRWRRRLGDAQLAEIDRAVRQASARGLGWQTMTADDFPLPSCAALGEDIRAELEDGSGIVLLQGLDPSRYSIDELRLLYAAIARQIGTSMSRPELTRLRVLIDVADGRLSVADATGLIGVGRRQTYRLLEAFRAHGADGLISRKRGQPSNRALGSVFRETVLAIVREHYRDFGPTLAAEKLSELHGLDLGVETLRQWMIGAGLWVRRKDRLKRIHQPRARRDCLGELVQIDGSEHWWFENRGPQCTLLVYVDDATSRLMHLKFVETESTFDYFQATREYLEAYGKPVAFYSDKHGVFRVNSTGAVQGDGMTQFGRSLHALNIDILCANTPQAKGRVERANKTLQDRLVKELRLQGISTIGAGNKLLPSFLADYNARFGKEPRNPKNLHRTLSAGDDLTDVFAWREERTVSNSLTLQYDKVLFLLEPSEITRELRRKRVTVIDYPDGRLAIRYRGLDLPYTTFDKLRQVSQATVVENKHLGAVLSQIRVRQLERSEARSQSAPRRQGQIDHMFKVG